MNEEIYRQREKKRNDCFLDGKCYVNEYKGGIKEYICITDKRPCLFQCMQLWDIVLCKDCKFTKNPPEWYASGEPCKSLVYCKKLETLVYYNFACIEGERANE